MPRCGSRGKELFFWRSIAMCAMLELFLVALPGCSGSGNQTVFLVGTPTPTPAPTSTPTATPTPVSPFSATGSMTAARKSHTATLLGTGQVLVVGGRDNNGNVLASAEVFDPTTGKFTATGNMSDSRESHTAALLTNGQVLIAGGQDDSGAVVASAELYDPTKGTFTLTTAAFPGTGSNMTDSREFHTATTLANGQVLIAGGQNNSSTILATAELYDPAKGSFVLTTAAFPGTGTNMTDSRENHTATLFTSGFLSGRVLIAGGLDSSSVVDASAELYDPANGSFTATGSMAAAREFETATLLANQQVLIAGGFGVSDALSSAELFNPATGTFAPTGNLTDARNLAAATQLGSGKVLVAGGSDLTDVLNSADLFDPAANSGAGAFTPAGTMIDSREDFTATLLPSGQVLLAGGIDDAGNTVASAELYKP
jgi:hypothetical protein